MPECAQGQTSESGWGNRSLRIPDKTPRTLKAARRPPSPYPTKPGAILRSRQRTMLEVILQNPRGQGGTHGASLRINRAHDFSAADDFCSR